MEWSNYWLHIPDDVPRVWSLEGPVFVVDVPPAFHIQLKSSSVSCVYVHMPCSKLQAWDDRVPDPGGPVGETVAPPEKVA